MIEFIRTCPVACENEFTLICQKILYHHRLRAEHAFPRPILLKSVDSISVLGNGGRIYVSVNDGGLDQLERVRGMEAAKCLSALHVYDFQR